jgi:hypothetical protein
MRGCRDAGSLVRSLQTDDQAPHETLAVGLLQGVSMLNFTMLISWTPERAGEMQCKSSTTQKTAYAARQAMCGPQRPPITSASVPGKNAGLRNVWIAWASGTMSSSERDPLSLGRQLWSNQAYSGSEMALRHRLRAFDRTQSSKWHKIDRGFAHYLDAACRLAGRKRAVGVCWGTLSIPTARFRRERRTSERQGGGATLDLSLFGFSLDVEVSI